MLKIPCGGFELNEESFTVNGSTLSALPTSWNDLTDKPFGEEIVKPFFLEETILTFARNVSIDGTLRCQADTENATGRLEHGKQYTVIWNDTAYKLTACSEEVESGATVVWMGNKNLVDIETSVGDIPFAIYNTPIEGKLWLTTHDGSTDSHKISIFETIIKPLDPKYLPDTVVKRDELSELVIQIVNESYASAEGESF